MNNPDNISSDLHNSAEDLLNAQAQAAAFAELNNEEDPVPRTGTTTPKSFSLKPEGGPRPAGTAGTAGTMLDSLAW